MQRHNIARENRSLTFTRHISGHENRALAADDQMLCWSQQEDESADGDRASHAGHHMAAARQKSPTASRSVRWVGRGPLLRHPERRRGVSVIYLHAGVNSTSTSVRPDVIVCNGSGVSKRQDEHYRRQNRYRYERNHLAGLWGQGTEGTPVTPCEVAPSSRSCLPFPFSSELGTHCQKTML